jgi:hypothetical protein
MKANKIFQSVLKMSSFKSVLLLLLTAATTTLQAQELTDLTTLTAFKSPSENWQLAGDAKASLDQNNLLIISRGTGILVSQVKEGKVGQDLLFNASHGDVDLELDYMMAKNSNSGIYLQGRYEIQLRDSWSVINAKARDNGGIYERWNEDKPEGQKGYEGYAPRQNASRAPGLWQHIKVSFQAPRFNASDQKTENARVLRVTLNGVIIQDNVELSGPTRGALQNNEVATGPLRFQGDHGTVAFRNIRLTHFDNTKPELLDIKYAVYKGKFQAEPDYKKLRPYAQGTAAILSSNVINIEKEFLIRYTGILRLNKPGAYHFNLNTPDASGSLTIDNKLLLHTEDGKENGEIILPAGDIPFQLVYAKVFDYAKPALTLSVAGAGLREYTITDVNVPSGNPIDPILIDAPVNTIVRSFMDVDSTRVTHAVNVGSPQQLHYTYDMDNGMIVQVWRGNFLDATPMWHSRGDGSSRAAGSVIKFGRPMMALQVLTLPDAAWSADTTGTAYRPKGYRLDENDLPTFHYQIYNTVVNDVSRIMDGNQGVYREISVTDTVPNLYLRLAEADSIEMSSANLYLINDKSYYLRLHEAGTMALIRNVNGRKELIVPMQKKISYSILF